MAANVSRGAGSTFDGIHPTNGYHPLRQLALVPLHRVASKPTAAWLAVGLQTLLFSASGLVLALFGGAIFVSAHIESRVGRELVSRLLTGGDSALLSHAASNLRELLTLGGRVPLAAPLALLPVLLFLALRAGKRGGGVLRGLMTATGIYGAVLLGFYALPYPSLLGTYTYYWLPLLYALVGVAFASLAVCGRRLRRWLTVAALLPFLAFDLIYTADRLGSWSFTVPEKDRPEAAGVRFLDSLEGEVLVGSWDAGYLGWKCRHPVVNLTGRCRATATRSS